MYHRNKQSDLEREKTGEWVRDYSKNNLGGDWDYCVGLSYRFPLQRSEVGFANLRKLYKTLKKHDENIEGFVATEMENGLKSLHHHLIVKSKMNDEIFKRSISSIWDRKGISWVDRYDRKKGKYTEYMCKHLGKTEHNTLDILSTFDI